jgi:hypothetical protein
LWGNRVLRRVPFYVARVACGFPIKGSFYRAMFPNRRVMLEAIRLVGLQLRVFVESCHVCPLCGLGAEGGWRRFKDRRGLYNHMVRKHYGDLMELVILISNSMPGRRR